MDNNLDKIASDLYGKIQTRFTDINIGDENADVLTKKVDIPKARFFEFDYTEDGEPIGTITITLDQDDGVVVQVSGDIVDDDHKASHKKAYKFIRSFRQFAKSRLLNFDVQNIGKSNLDKRDYEFQSKHKEPVMENKMFGTSRLSYQNLGEARLVVKHSQPINPDLAAGRTMHISSIYIENADGERFKYPYKHLSGARALAEHVNHGGNPYDEIGKYITKLSEELNSLRKFKGYVGRQTQISEAMGSITNQVIDRIDEVKKEIQNLQRPAYYEQFAESFIAAEELKVPETVMNDWIDRLTIRTFNEDMKAVFPFLYNIVHESDLPVRKLSAKDLMGRIKTDTTVTSETKTIKYRAPELEIEDMLESIVSEDKNEITGPNKGPALERLNDRLKNNMNGGTTGVLALKGLIDDKHIVELIRNIDYQDSYAEDKAVRDIIADYIKGHNAKDLEALPNLYIETPQEIGGQDLPPDANSGEPLDSSEPSDMPPDSTAGAGGLPALGGGGGMPPLGGDETPPEGEPGAEGELPPPGAAPGAAPAGPAAAETPEAPAEAPAEPVKEELKRYRKLAGLLGEDEVESEQVEVEHIEPKIVYEQPTQVNEGMQHKKNKMKAKFIKAKAAGAKLDTKIAEGMTIRDLIRESGMTPDEVGYEEIDDSKETEKSGIQQILDSIEGFWNNEEKNFTIGGTRVKTIIKKNFDDNEYDSSVSEDDVRYVMKKVSQLDPSEDADSEHSDIMRLAGVGNTDEHNPDEMDDGKSIELLMKELYGFGKRYKLSSIDKHKARRTMRNNYERNYKNNTSRFR
jgi:hypothetical protein